MGSAAWNQLVAARSEARSCKNARALHEYNETSLAKKDDEVKKVIRWKHEAPMRFNELPPAKRRLSATLRYKDLHFTDLHTCLQNRNRYMKYYRGIGFAQ